MTESMLERGGAPVDSDAFDRAAEHIRRLYDAHMAEVHRYVHGRCGDRQLAEDVTHDVFVRLIDHPDVTSLTVGWLKTAARNRMIDILRRRENHGAKLRLLQPLSTESGFGADAEHAWRFEAALEELKPLHRMVLMLRYVDGYSTADLATQLGRSERGIESLVARAKAALRTQLEIADVD